MRYTLKGVIVWFLHLFTWPFTVPSLIAYRFFGSEELFSTSAKLLSLIPGKLGQYIRTSFYCQTLTHCKYDLAVGFCSYFAHPTAIAGRHVGVGSFSIIGTVKLGNDVYISSRVSILSGKYQHGAGLGNKGVGSGNIKFQEITIGDRVWIGEGAIVMANIENDCIVSAGSVVTKLMPSNNTAIGNPARFLKREYGNESKTG